MREERGQNTHNFMNISFDLVTLGNTHNAPIVQIGACKFENNLNK